MGYRFHPVHLPHHIAQAGYLVEDVLLGMVLANIANNYFRNFILPVTVAVVVDIPLLGTLDDPIIILHRGKREPQGRTCIDDDGG